MGAFSVLRIPNKDILNSLNAELLRKPNETPPMGLVQHIDAQYNIPNVADEKKLSARMYERIVDAAHFLTTFWSEWEALQQHTTQRYEELLSSVGLHSLGVVGTPKLLQHLQIDLPSRKFMNQCRDKAWTKHNYPRVGNSGKYSAAHIELTTFSSALPLEWVMCSAGDHVLQDKRCFFTVDMP